MGFSSNVGDLLTNQPREGEIVTSKPKTAGRWEEDIGVGMKHWFGILPSGAAAGVLSVSSHFIFERILQGIIHFTKLATFAKITQLVCGRLR
jgi:hypothetical protein